MEIALWTTSKDPLLEGCFSVTINLHHTKKNTNKLLKVLKNTRLDKLQIAVKLQIS